MSQESFIGDLQGLFAAFRQEWSRFWTRHSQDRPERWTAAIQDSHLPAIPEMRLPPITSAQWRAAVRKKKHYSASGLDGWSRADLLLFPEDPVEELLAIYAHAESCGVWPRQALEGLVSALEKRPSAAAWATTGLLQFWQCHTEFGAALGPGSVYCTFPSCKCQAFSATFLVNPLHLCGFRCSLVLKPATFSAAPAVDWLPTSL